MGFRWSKPTDCTPEIFLEGHGTPRFVCGAVGTNGNKKILGTSVKLGDIFAVFDSLFCSSACRFSCIYVVDWTEEIFAGLYIFCVVNVRVLSETLVGMFVAGTRFEGMGKKPAVWTLRPKHYRKALLTTPVCFLVKEMVPQKLVLYLFDDPVVYAAC